MCDDRVTTEAFDINLDGKPDETRVYGSVNGKWQITEKWIDMNGDGKREQWFMMGADDKITTSVFDTNRDGWFDEIKISGYLDGKWQVLLSWSDLDHDGEFDSLTSYGARGSLEAWKTSRVSPGVFRYSKRGSLGKVLISGTASGFGVRVLNDVTTQSLPELIWPPVLPLTKMRGPAEEITFGADKRIVRTEFEIDGLQVTMEALTTSGSLPQMTRVFDKRSNTSVTLYDLNRDGKYETVMWGIGNTRERGIARDKNGDGNYDYFEMADRESSRYVFDEDFDGRADRVNTRSKAGKEEFVGSQIADRAMPSLPTRVAGVIELLKGGLRK
jgi:hypothetical protein